MFKITHVCSYYGAWPGQAVSVSGSPNTPTPISMARPLQLGASSNELCSSFIQSSLFKKIEKSSLSYGRFRPHFLNDGF